VPIATGLAIGLGVASAAAGVGGAAISAHAAGKAGETQANAADYAANLQKQEADAALAFQKQQWDTQQKNLEPWLTAGKAGLTDLSQLLGVSGDPKSAGYGSLMKPFGETFTAPTSVTEQNDPGYQFRLDQGMKALQNSAAAKGGLLSGNTATALNNWVQNDASNEYGNVYNRAFGEFQQRYNIYNQNQNTQYNRLAALSGTGQTTATTLGQQGQAAANNISGINLTAGAQQGQDLQNAAAARASGYVGSANAYSGAVSGGTNSLIDLYLLSQMNKTPTPGYGATPSVG
jgi:hypothetical protein